jgi:hypothetical protein
MKRIHQNQLIIKANVRFLSAFCKYFIVLILIISLDELHFLVFANYNSLNLYNSYKSIDGHFSAHWRFPTFVRSSYTFTQNFG